jgi:hypothetical protein
MTQTPKEKLEKIISNAIYNTTYYFLSGGLKKGVDDTVSAILADFIPKDAIELDEEKMLEVMRKSHFSWLNSDTGYSNILNHYAHALATHGKELMKQ